MSRISQHFKSNSSAKSWNSGGLGTWNTRLRFECEHLERREMLAGDVDVIARNGDVLVTGDNASNMIRVESTNGRIQVTGINGTRVNGIANGVISRSIADDLKINLKQGDNQLTLGSQASSLMVPDDLVVKTGHGDDVIVAPNVSVGDDATFSLGHGFNRATLFELSFVYGYTVGDDLKISSPGLSQIYVDWRIVDDTRISTGHHGDSVRLYDSVVAGNLSISTKGGGDSIELTQTVIGGNLNLSSHGGDDSFTFGGVGSAAYGDIRLSMSHGFDYARITASLSPDTTIRASGVEIG